MSYLKKIKKVLDKILGTKSNELSWRFRHFFDNEWAKSYISESAIKHPHRKLLVEDISKTYPFENVLEVGCASGANLYLLAEKFPKVSFYGIDISKNAIKEGKNFFYRKSFKNIFLQNLGINQLENFTDKSMDIIFTDATIIYIGKDQIEKVFKEMCRIAKKTIILCEQHTEGKSFYDNKWVHNYREIINKVVPQAKIIFTKIPENIWAGEWAKYGYIIEVKL
ncbi:MAG: class I SAM-dependent methyltransferase [Candidatus Staskawiczbacteria bacterium]|jgi:ubiquinone/menaquinone biosynthesis C-methylase UbiE